MSTPNLRPSLGTRAEQTLRLEPRMLQAIEVLQLPAQDLEAWLLDAAERNEALVVEAPCAEGPGRSAAGWEATERHDEVLRNQPDREESLFESLEQQLGWLELEPRLEAAVRFLLSCLDENGYLTPSDEELLALAAEAKIELDTSLLARGIAEVQRLEPRGVGGRDLIECLLLQLDPSCEDYSLLCRLLEEFLEELAANRMPRVAQGLGVDLEQLGGLLSELRGLNPRPGAELASSSAPLVRADVLVLPTEDGGFEVRVDRASQPSVTLDPELSEHARDRKQSRESRAWARERVERARWVVDAVRQRADTLLRVATSIFSLQRTFLEEGPGHLVPSTMSALAEELGVHVSTISRAVAGKHAQTPWGVFPLRYFFQSATPLSPEAEGAATARDDLREVVRSVFEAEDKRSPLSDDEVAAELARRGHPVARRTVAKYRKELGIQSSYRRREFL
jgi:RNA polymerase sigma-54 factor